MCGQFRIDGILDWEFGIDGILDREFGIDGILDREFGIDGLLDRCQPTMVSRVLGTWRIRQPIMANVHFKLVDV